VQDETIPYGYCQCGCGLPTTINEKHNKRYGWVKGEHKRFRKGHWPRFRGPTPWTDTLWHDEDRGFSTPCRIWDGAKNALGYGYFRDGLAYGYAWELVNGPVPNGLELDHLCRQSECINTDHLEAVTHQENLRRGAGTKLSYALAQEIRAAYIPRRVTLTMLAERYGVCQRTIWVILKDKRWTH
jgi:hypothetical protein